MRRSDGKLDTREVLTRVIIILRESMNTKVLRMGGDNLI
jgi:hypothetical protein